MRNTTISAILVLALAQMASAAQTLTINGEALDAIKLKTGQSCTVEVVSDNSNPYSAYVGFDERVVLGSFDQEMVMPEAGDLASITEYDIPAFYGYFVSAAGTSPPPSPGEHFVVIYRLQQVGETELKLYDITLTVIDSVHITVVPAQMGTAFTYQGRLMETDHPAEGQHDFTFVLYDSPSDGNQLQSKSDINDLDVIDGYFTAELDFGSNVFDGDARWLEVSVRPGDSNDPNAFVSLSPRQKLTPAPYALQTRGIFVDDSGNVGIGNTEPWYLLDVFKNVTGNWLAGFHNTGAGDMDGGVIVRAFGGDPLLVQSATENVLNVKQNGNVGIGTVLPDKKLTVAEGGFAVYPGQGSEPSIITDGFNVKLGDSDGLGNQVFLEVDDLTEKFVFNNGSVGIGTESPTRDIHIYRDTGPAQIGIVTADTSSKAQIIFGDSGGNNWTISSDNTDDNKLHFRSGHASGTPQVTFQQDGNVGIGTTSPAAKLDVNGYIQTHDDLPFSVKRYTGTLGSTSSLLLEHGITNGHYKCLIVQAWCKTSDINDWMWPMIVEYINETHIMLNAGVGISNQPYRVTVIYTNNSHSW